MKTKKKLTLAFGIQTTLLVLLGLAILREMRSIANHTQLQASTTRPRAMAVQELEAAVARYAIGVRSFQLSGKAEGKEEAANAAAEVRQTQNKYQNMSRTADQQGLAIRFETLWNNYLTIGDRLLETSNRPAQPETLNQLVGARRELETFLRDEMKAEATHAAETELTETIGQLKQAAGLTATLLLAGVILALTTSLTAARAVLAGEQAIRTSADQWQTTFDSVADAIWLMDEKCRILRCNAAAQRFLGKAQQEIIGRHCCKLVHGTTGPLAECPLSQTCTSRQRETTELEIDGRWNRITLDPIVAPSGELSGIVHTLHDITERKQAEELLRLSQSRAELLARVISRLLTASNPQTVVEQLCDEVRKFLRCAVFFNYQLDAQSQRLRFNACGGVDPRVARLVEDLELSDSLCGTAARDNCRVLAENLAVTFDARSELVRSLGVRAYACHPLMGSGDRAFGTLSFGATDRDVFSEDDLALMKTVADHVATAMLRCRAEEALRRARDELEQRVTERTTELASINQRLMTEIAERTNAEAVLRRQAALLNMISDAVIIWEFSGGIRYWNRGAEQLYGFNATEAAGRISHELLATDFPHGMQAFIAALNQHGEWKGEVAQATQSGRKIIVESHQQLVEQPDGTLLVLETNHDITERLKFHEDIVAAGERERQRLGRNLHDGLCQLLTAARLKADSLTARLATHASTEHTTAKSLVNLLNNALEESRRMARGLEPVEPLPEGLMVALNELATTTQQLFDVACKCKIPASVLVADHTAATELFHIAQEAVNNAIKHSQAKFISVQLSKDSDNIILAMSCDGVPFPKRPRPHGTGLKAMKYRARRIGASLDLRSGPGGGTLMRCVLHQPEQKPIAPDPPATSGNRLARTAMRTLGSAAPASAAKPGNQDDERAE